MFGQAPPLQGIAMILQVFAQNSKIMAAAP
jgi:hypothetical protein